MHFHRKSVTHLLLHCGSALGDCLDGVMHAFVLAASGIISAAGT